MDSVKDRKIPPPEDRFKMTLLSLSNIMLREIEKKRARGEKTIAKETLMFGLEMIKATKSDVIIGGFLTRSFDVENGKKRDLWDRVLEKDRDFFMQKSETLFGELSSGIVEGFKDLIRQGDVDEKLMKTIWDHLSAMVKMSISYVHLSRKPQITSTDNGFKVDYTIDYRKEIDLHNEAKKWNFNLAEAK
jgi:hypothetical protein